MLPLPQYPNATPLCFEHKSILDQHHHENVYRMTATSFTNLFLLDSENRTMLSQLNGNIIVVRQEEALPRPTVFVVGKKMIAETLHQLQQSGIDIIDQFPDYIEGANEDLDNEDYLYSISNTAAMAGSDYAGMRRKVNTFRRYPDVSFGAVDTAYLSHIEDFDREWRKQYRKRRAFDDALMEEELAFEKSILFFRPLNLQAFTLHVQDTMIGYIIGEIIVEDTLAIHFFKTNTAYTGAGEYMFHQLATVLPSTTTWINFEQDLGIEGLRRFKQSLCPTEKIKVYTITTTR